MVTQYSMSCEEKWERYKRMRREAASELMNFIHGIATDDDAYDRSELATLWRLSCEGVIMSEPTWEQMLEATNV